MTRQHAKIHPFLHAAAILEKRLESLLGSSEIRHRQALVLDALQQIGSSSQQHLAKQFSVSPGTMSSMISRLETLGYVQRQTNPTDRRADVINVTSSGLAVVAGVAEIWHQSDEVVADILGDEESEQFFALSDKLSKALRGGPPKKEN